MTATTAHPRTTGPAASGPRPTRPLPSRPAGARARDPRPPAFLAPADRLASAERLTAALGRWYLDAQAGRVEVRQLRRLLTPTAEQRVLGSVLRARARHRLGDIRPATRLRVRRVIVRQTGDHYEALALVDDGSRTLPVAAVLHATARGWVISDLARPDDGLPAMPVPMIR